MRFDILTIFPEMFATLINYGIIGRAVKKGQIKINVVNIRDFSKGPHMMTDDRPFGGGDGMVMKPGPIFQALESIPREKGDRRVILLTPQGQPFNQSIARDLTKLKQIVLVCGRYEGVDERVRSRCVDMELSIGDYVLYDDYQYLQAELSKVTDQLVDMTATARSATAGSRSAASWQ